MKIMLSNDDGIKAEGLNILYESLGEVAEIFVIAPDKEMSGTGSSITTKRPLKPTEIKKNFVAVNGTPVDCVHLGLHQLCPFKPDLLISGIRSALFRYSWCCNGRQRPFNSFHCSFSSCFHNGNSSWSFL